jgi:SAM-dependent methyltransferase
VYRHGTGGELCYSSLTNYLDALAHKHSDLVILEVGAGTGGATLSVLNTLTRHGESEVGAGRFERYDFTDISSSFFENAKVTFKSTIDRMRFQTFNIEKDPFEQGFQADQYDLIIAGNVVHATKNIDHTLKNLRKLLKPGGTLILHELTNTALVRTGFAIGLVPGWWLSEEPHRAWGPLMSASDWEVHLKRSGYTGVDLCFEDYPYEPNRINSILIAKGEASVPQPRALPPVIIVIDGNSDFQNSVAKEIQRGISSLGAPQCEVAAIHQLDGTDFAGKLCVVLADVEGGSLLEHVDEAKLKILQKMTTKLASLVWLTLGGGPASQNPNGEMVTGLARVMRQENPTLSFITIAIARLRGAAVVAETTTSIINSTLVKRARDARDASDNAFYESEGVIHISRLVEASYMNDAIIRKTTQPAAQQQQFAATLSVL